MIMNVDQMARHFNLDKRQVERVKAIFAKLDEPGHKTFYCGSCTGEYFDWQLVDNHCPMCLSDDELEVIDY